VPTSADTRIASITGRALSRVPVLHMPVVSTSILQVKEIGPGRDRSPRGSPSETCREAVLRRHGIDCGCAPENQPLSVAHGLAESEPEAAGNHPRH